MRYTTFFFVSLLIIGLLLIGLTSLVRADEEPYHYWYASENSFGVTSGKDINWSYFKQFFLNRIEVDAFWRWSAGGSWKNGNQYLDWVKSWNESGFWKIGFYVNYTAPNPIDAKIVFKIDTELLSYMDRSSKYEYWLNFTIPNSGDEVYQCFFNWSDLLGISGLDITKYRIGDIWHFQLQRNNCPIGTHSFYFDPRFGWWGAEDTYRYLMGEFLSGWNQAFWQWTECNITGSVTSMAVKTDTVNANYDMQCMIHEWDGAADVGNLVAWSEIKAVTTSDDNIWFYFDMPSQPSVTSGTKYFLGVRSLDCLDANVRLKATNQDKHVRIIDYCPWTNISNPPTGEQNMTGKIIIYANVTESGGEEFNNTCPTMSNEQPTNRSVEIELYPSLNITVGDVDANHTMNVTFWSNSTGSWVNHGTNKSVSNGTYRLMNASWVDERYTWYYWRVTVDDGFCNVSEIYHFRTDPDRYFLNGTIQTTNYDGKQSWLATGPNINQAIWSLNDTGGTVYLPVGNFTITTPLILNHNISLIGHNNYPNTENNPNMGTVIIASGCEIVNQSGTDNSDNRCIIKNIAFQMANGYDGFWLNNNIDIKDCSIRGDSDTGYGIYLNYTYDSIIEKVRIVNCYTGIYINQCNFIRVRDLRITSCEVSGIHIQSGTFNYIERVDFSSNEVEGITIYGGRNHKIEDCWFEANGFCGINLTGNCRNHYIFNCRQSGGSHSVYSPTDGMARHNITISNCFFDKKLDLRDYYFLNYYGQNNIVDETSNFVAVTHGNVWTRYNTTTNGLYFFNVSCNCWTLVTGSGDGYRTQEEIEDFAGDMWNSNVEIGINVSYVDANGTISIWNNRSTVSAEQIQDVCGAMFDNNVENNITLLYIDTNGTISVWNNVTGSNLSNEQVQDIVGAMFTNNVEINGTLLYIDHNGTISLWNNHSEVNYFNLTGLASVSGSMQTDILLIDETVLIALFLILIFLIVWPSSNEQKEYHIAYLVLGLLIAGLSFVIFNNYVNSIWIIFAGSGFGILGFVRFLRGV